MNIFCLSCWRYTAIFTEKVKSYVMEENPVEIRGSFAWISTERFGLWDGNRPWSFTKVLQSSLFPLLFSFKHDDWSCLDAELIWTKNKYLLKQDLHPLVSQKVCSGMKVYCCWCWFSRLAFHLCELWNTDFTLLLWKRPRLWASYCVAKDWTSSSELVSLLTYHHHLLQALKNEKKWKPATSHCLETLKKKYSLLHAHEKQIQTDAINVNYDFLSGFPL